MFNPLTPSQMVTAIGLAARAAGRGQESLGRFERGQLMSAYSASRHLAIELDSFGAELREACETIAVAAAGATRHLGDPDESEAVRALGARIRTAGGPDQAGAAIAELLAVARTHAGEPWAELRDRTRGCLRDLCRNEVSLLAQGIEAGRA